MTLTILADDLTGACDTGSLFAGRATVPVTVWPDAPFTSADVRVADTETRTLTAAEASARVASTAAAAPAQRYFKKIDSTFRGRIGAEVEALLGATGTTTALVCPSFPAQRRTVIDRMLLVDGKPVAESAIAGDPEFPLAALGGSASSVVDLLRPQISRPLAWIPLAEVRTGGDALAARLSRLAGTFAVADAETDDDLDRLVDAALTIEPAPLLVGSAGFGRALARRLGVLAERAPLPEGKRWLVVVGSRHPASRLQADVARLAGLLVLDAPGESGRDPQAVAARLGEDVRRTLDRNPVDVIAVTGGETAVAVYRALAAERLDLVGAPRPGLALGRLCARHRADVWLLTKAGGFGAPDLFVELAGKKVAA